MLGRLLSLFTALMLASAPASAYAPEQTLVSPELRVSAAKTASRDFVAPAKQAAKKNPAASACRVWEIWSPPEKLASSMGFTGYYADAESGDYYAQQRYYRQGVGRFLSVDPWSGDPNNPITLNKYLYANGNPLIYLDPDGRQACNWCVAYGYAESDDQRHRVLRDLANRDPRIGVPAGAALNVGRGVGNVVSAVDDIQSEDPEAQQRTAARIDAFVDGQIENAMLMARGPGAVGEKMVRDLGTSIGVNAANLVMAAEEYDWVGVGDSGTGLVSDGTAVFGITAAARAGVRQGIGGLSNSAERVQESSRAGRQNTLVVAEGDDINPVAVSEDRRLHYPPSLLDEIVADASSVSAQPNGIGEAQVLALRQNLPIVQRRGPAQNRVSRSEFEKDRQSLIQQWERGTGESWPSGATPHHIVPLESGGANKWYNLMPTYGALPNHSLPGVRGPHAAGSVLRQTIQQSRKKLPPGRETDLRRSREHD